MKNNLLLLLVSTFLFVACGNNKNVDPSVAGTITDPPIVKTDPAKFTLTVINNTDQDMKWEQSWAMTGPDSGVVAAGDTVLLSSNEIDSDHINVYPIAPKSIDQPNPGNGTFGMQYGYDGHIARVYCDNVCNKGYPTADVHYEGTNWIYATEWLKDPAVETNTTNTVTITTEAWPVTK
jgi:hypothetical protein|tara:strand:- start:2086 stop:2619 length:534 start_codon:yes stop_codon:yes gene_type:complete